MGSVQRTGRSVVLQLAYGVGDPAPYRGAVVIILGRQLLGASMASTAGFDHHLLATKAIFCWPSTIRGFRSISHN